MRPVRRALAGAVWACVGLACGDQQAAAPARQDAGLGSSSAAATVQDTERREPQTVVPVPSVSDSASVGKSTPSRKVSRKPRSCVVIEESLVRAGSARGLLSASPDELLVLSDEKPKLELWRDRGHGLQPSAELGLESAVKRAAFLHTEGSTFAAWVDERARLMLVAIDGDQFGRARSLAEGVDRRFAPALAQVKSQLLLAFTRSVAESMHVHVVRVQAQDKHGEHSTLEDLTPAGHGASAPTFIAGVAPPSLVVVDAHAGVSPLLEVAFDGAGRAQPAVVRTPVSQPYAPPALAAVQLTPTRTVVAYTAIGRAAATAIGLVPLRSAEAPMALVPSNGYGELALSVAKQAGLAVFAVEDFKGSTKDAPRKVLVGVVDAAGVGELVELGAAAAHASSPSIRADGAPGEFTVAYASPQGVHAARVLCSP